LVSFPAIRDSILGISQRLIKASKAKEVVNIIIFIGKRLSLWLIASKLKNIINNYYECYHSITQTLF